MHFRTSFLFYIFFGAYNLPIYAQPKAIDTTSLKKPPFVYLKIAPLSLLDIGGGPVARIGIEKSLANRFAAYVEYGAFIPGIRYKHDKLHGSIFRIEPKIYLERNNNHTGLYISLEYFYKTQAYYQQDSVHLGISYVVENKYTKNIQCINLRFGKLTQYANKLMTEVFFGLGVMHKRVQTNISEQEQNSIYFPGDYYGGIPGWTSMVGDFWVPYVIGGFKFGLGIK